MYGGRCPARRGGWLVPVKADRVASTSMSYSSVANHGSMVFDAHRNTLYGRAISAHVGPDSIVLDLGAGLGVHGLLAAAAGALRVYLVEPQPLVQVAADTARASGLDRQAIVFQDRIEHVQLPEPVDLIVSVFTGNLLFSEDLLPSLFHARDRYLKPGGKLLPDRAQLWLAPLCAPQLHAKHVQRWSEPVMGLDYSRARSFAGNEIIVLRRDELEGSHRLATGAAVADLDLTTATSADCRGEAVVRVATSGLCHGLLGWIRIRLADEWLSTEPEAPEVHWSPVLLPVDPPLPLTAGELLKVVVQRPAHGDWTWSLTAQAGARRQSTFLARADGPKELAKAAPGTRPSLSQRGKRALDALQLLSQGSSIQEAAQALARSTHIDAAQALREVEALAMRYGSTK